MPIDQEHNGVDDEWVALHPGAYEDALQRVCDESTDDRYGALRCANDQEITKLRRRHAARTAALVRKRRGKPVHCLSHHLPDELVRRFPRGHHAFVVTPEDVTTMEPQPVVRKRLDDTPRSRPGPVPSQTVAEARTHGMGAPETLGWRPDLPHG